MTDPLNRAAVGTLKHALLVGGIERRMGGAYVLAAVSVIIAVVVMWRIYG